MLRTPFRRENWCVHLGVCCQLAVIKETLEGGKMMYAVGSFLSTCCCWGHSWKEKWYVHLGATYLLAAVENKEEEMMYGFGSLLSTSCCWEHPRGGKNNACSAQEFTHSLCSRFLGSHYLGKHLRPKRKLVKFFESISWSFSHVSIRRV